MSKPHLLQPPNSHMRRVDKDDLVMIWHMQTFPSSLMSSDRNAGIVKGPGGTVWGTTFCYFCGHPVQRVLLENLITAFAVCARCFDEKGSIACPEIPDEIVHYSDKPKETRHVSRV